MAAGAFTLTLLLSTLIIITIMLWVGKPQISKKNIPVLIRGLVISIAVPLTIAFLSVLTVDGIQITDYVTNRLGGIATATDDDNSNISSLVVLQGFDLAKESIIASYGLGVGAGNMGTSPELFKDNFYRNILNTILTGVEDINLREGSLLLSKTVSELGIFSLVIFWTIISNLRYLHNQHDSNTKKYHSAFLAISICLITVRALPYFAAPTCLAFISIAAIATARTSRKLRAAMPIVESKT
ncbi:hypothetical protein ACVBEH_14135 [Roseateles sp. GG27B]